MIKFFIVFVPAIMLACSPTPEPPKHPKHWMVDKAWETDDTWYEYCSTHNSPMCYGAVKRTSK